MKWWLIIVMFAMIIGLGLLVSISHRGLYLVGIFAGGITTASLAFFCSDSERDTKDN